MPAVFLKMGEHESAQAAESVAKENAIRPGRHIPAYRFANIVHRTLVVVAQHPYNKGGASGVYRREFVATDASWSIPNERDCDHD